ncbi:ketopantoate reductase family protein [Novosphingobium jiangmenense]
MIERVVVVGAGAMGCLFAARLAHAGSMVTVVDVDQARLDHISAEGIRLHDEFGERTIRVAASTAQAAPSADLVLLFTKAVHSRSAIASVAHLADGNACALTLQNGLGNAEALAEVFAPEKVLLGVTDWPADLAPPNGVSAHGTGHVWLGALNPASAPAANAVVELLDAARMSAQHDTQVLEAIWEKAAFNAALNALSTILNTPVGGLDTPDGRRIATAVIDETIAVALTRNIAMNRERLLAKMDFALANHKAHKPSMLQDRLAGRATEIEAINGQIVLAAREAGIAAPVTETLAALVRMGEPGRN